MRTLVLCCCLVLPVGTSISSGADQSNAEKPNIVFILADDLGSADVGWRGSQIKTPHLDKLAAAGAKFEQFYVMPLCSPTRACLMTGRYPMRYGLQVGVVRPWATYGLPLEERTLAQGLREAGYTTAICGKWHLGNFDKAYWPNARGFDHWYGHLLGALDYFTHIRDGALDWYRNGQPLKEKGYSTHLIAQESVRLIREQPPQKPLFLYVPFNAVHSPNQVPDSYKQPYGGDTKEAVYAGMVAALDEAIGQILTAIDETGRRRNTLIIFSSDNGGPVPRSHNEPYRAGKGTVYEGGVRVCACASWEGVIKPGTTIAAPLHMVDWYPTLLKLAGGTLQQPKPLDGKDIWACLTEGAASPHKELLFNTTPNGGALRVGDWKLVVHNATSQPAKSKNNENRPRARSRAARKPLELYNLANDPGEKHDLSDQHPDKVKQLQQRYADYADAAVVPLATTDEGTRTGGPKAAGRGSR